MPRRASFLARRKAQPTAVSEHIVAGTYLTTSFAERARVKALGARWDAERRQWFVPAGLSLEPFRAWLPQALDTALTLPAPETKGVGLSQLLAGLSEAISRAFAAPVWVRVEVTNVRLSRGAISLELAESSPDGTAIAQARGLIWASTANQIVPPFEAATGVVLGAGIKLLVRARPNLHPQFGLSLVIDAMDPDYTLGDLEARKREIRSRLQQQGLFDLNRRLPRPWDYRAVLVLAPLQAAGLGDFQADAKRLAEHGICVFTYLHSRFQGEGAAAEMRGALLDGIARSSETEPPDAVVIIRGGGPVNDLAWLNDYDLARAVCELPVPVLTGIGHERDSTILDEVAHCRFDTPSKVIAGIEQTIARRVREVQAAFGEVVALAQRANAQAIRSVEQADAAVGDSARRQLALAAASSDRSFQQVQRAARNAVRAAEERTERAIGHVRQAAIRELATARERVPALLADVALHARRVVGAGQAAVLEVRNTFSRAQVAVRRGQQVVETTMGEIALDARRTVRTAAEKSEALMREVAGQGPEKTLQRGFAVVRSPDGKALTNVRQAAGHEEIQIQFKDGTLPVRVRSEDV
jgi:exodeoxyribonuclease VII large subunit